MATTNASPREAIQYVLPRDWTRYDLRAITADLIEAKTALRVLTSLPYQKSWFDSLHQRQLRLEVSSTVRVGGSDFTESEFESAVRPDAVPEDLHMKSQRQAHAAVKTYRWIATLPDDRAINLDLVREIHRRIVDGCDDQQCEPGGFRRTDHDLPFAVSSLPGCEGGPPCQAALERLVYAMQHEFRGHDALVQALAAHYHMAAMQPFGDGNGRTARALEALMLQRADLAGPGFLAMSNFYCEEKSAYLRSLSTVRAIEHDLTVFLKLSLRGVAVQAIRVSAAFKKNMERALFRNTMHDLFNRPERSRKKIIRDRQIEILKILLDLEQIEWTELGSRMKRYYENADTFMRTIVRDINGLIQVGAISAKKVTDQRLEIALCPQWPREISEDDFFDRVNRSVPASIITDRNR